MIKEDILCRDPEEDQEEAALAEAHAEAVASAEVAAVALAEDVTAALAVRTVREDRDAADFICTEDTVTAVAVALEVS